MSVTTSRELLVEPEVAEFLRQHHADGAFQTALGIVRGLFPDLGLKVWLLEDPDEENHTWIILEVATLTADPEQTLRHQINRFHEELRQRLALPYHPFSFSLLLN